MNRRRQEPVNVRISDEEYSRLENKFEVLRNEFLACKRKLDSKCEALLILSKELDQCRSERDQFKLMAEQLRERYQTIKKQGYGQTACRNTSREYKNYSDMQSQSLATLLYEAKDANKSLQFEHDDLKQKLQDALGDIKLLREQIARQRVGTTDEGMTTRHFPAHEREELVQKLESTREEYLQLERDLQTVLDEKEEHVTERDVYKTKYERLNTELNYILKGDENRVVDIDALVMENKYLQERMKQMEEEKSMALAAVSKYKSLLEKKKTKSSLKLGQSRGGGMIITQKQVQQVLDSKSAQIPSPQAMSDLQALAGALLDTVNDKNLALSHQRKTNKILGNRVAELEKKIKTLEVAGLWNVPSNVSASLEKLRQECDDVKTLIPRQMSETSESEVDKDSELETVTPLDSCDVTPECSPTHLMKQSRHLELEDLDLLPTKEVSIKPLHRDILHKPDTGLHLLPVHPSDDVSLNHISSINSDSACEIQEVSEHIPSHDTISNTNIKDVYDPLEPVQVYSGGKHVYSTIAPVDTDPASDKSVCNTIATHNIVDIGDPLEDNGEQQPSHETITNTTVIDGNPSLEGNSDQVNVDNGILPLSTLTGPLSVSLEPVQVYSEDKSDYNTTANADLEFVSESLKAHSDPVDVDNRVTASPEPVQVYSDDKNEETDNDESEVSEEASDKFISENAEEETRDFYTDKTETSQRLGSGDGDYFDGVESENCVDTDSSSEKIGLLMENVAKKMCNISHKTVIASETNWAAGDMGAQGMKDVEPDVRASESPEPDCPLLGTEQESDTDVCNTTADDPHDVEC